MRAAYFAVLISVCGCGSTSSETQAHGPARVVIPADVEQRLAWFASTSRIVSCIRNDEATLPLLDACARHFAAQHYCFATRAVSGPTDAVVIFGRVEANALRECLVGASNETVTFTANGELVTATARAEDAAEPYVLLIPNAGGGIALLGEGVTASSVGPGRSSSVLDNASVRALLGKVDLDGSWLVAATDITSPFLGAASQTTSARISLAPSGAFSAFDAEIVFENTARAESARRALDGGELPPALRQMIGALRLTAEQHDNRLLVAAH